MVGSTKKPLPPKKSSANDRLSRKFEAYIARSIVPDPKKEYKFSPTLGFRFDYAWEDVKLAVEIDGGIYAKGRHIRPEGYTRDCEKLNFAQIAGWCVLRFTELNIDTSAEVTEKAYFTRLENLNEDTETAQVCHV